MTLDEAIKHAEEVAEEQGELCKRYDEASRHYRSYNEVFVSMFAKKSLECFECAEEHRQLAEWLKDYKRLLEQEPCEVEATKLQQAYNKGFEDCRQAVLSYIYNDLGLGDEENGKDVERQMELESSYKYIKSLPPVTPQQRIGHCKDCKHFRKLPYHADALGKCIHHGGFCPKGDWYCADYEPQESEDKK